MELRGSRRSIASGVNGEGGTDNCTGSSRGATGKSRNPLVLLIPLEVGRISGDEIGGRSGDASSSSGIWPGSKGSNSKTVLSWRPVASIELFRDPRRDSTALRDAGDMKGLIAAGLLRVSASAAASAIDGVTAAVATLVCTAGKVEADGRVPSLSDCSSSDTSFGATAGDFAIWMRDKLLSEPDRGRDDG